MKIAIALPQGYRFDPNAPNSIETVVRTLNARSKFRETVRVFADDYDNSGAERDLLSITRVDANHSRKARNDRIIAAIREWQPDLIEVHQHVRTACQIRKAFADIPTFLYRHAFPRKNVGWIKRHFQNRRFSKFDRMIFVGDAQRQAFVKRFPNLEDKSVVVPNAIEHEPWLGTVDEKEQLIAFCGRASDEKGFSEACAAVAEALARHEDWKAEFHVLRWSDHQDWSERSIRCLQQFGDRFVLKKDQPPKAVQELLKRAAIAVVPSKVEEAFGLTALEAHLAGCAVISSGKGGLRDVSDRFAIYVDDVTHDSILRSINYAQENNEIRKKIAESGQQFAIQSNSTNVNAPHLDKMRISIIDNY